MTTGTWHALLKEVVPKCGAPMTQRVRVCGNTLYSHRGHSHYSKNRSNYVYAESIPVAATVAPNVTRLVMDLQEICLLPRLHWVSAGKTLLLLMTTDGEYGSGVLVRGSQCCPILLGHVFLTSGIWHCTKPATTDYRHLEDNYSIYARPHLEWPGQISALQRQLFQQLASKRTPAVYGHELDKGEARAFATSGLAEVQRRRLHGNTATLELLRLIHLTEGEEWGLILNSRPSALC